jgi:nucleoid-associated protein YgaU/uncharacterized protein YukE
VSFFSDIEGIFDPGGDPAAIRGAAGACRTLASSLRDAVAALDSVADGLQKSWRGVAGAEEQSAGAAFQRAWRGFSAAIADYAGRLDQAAGQLDQVAAEIQSADQQAARLKEVALAALAVGAGLTLFTFGISDAAAEASAMADVAVATGLMSALDATLADAAAMLGDLLSAFVQVAARFAMGAGFSLASEMISKLAFYHENPLDPASYSANDVSNVLLGGMLTAGMGEVIANSTSLSDFMSDHPVAGTAASGATGGLLGSAISQFAIQGKKLDASTLETVAAGTALSAVSGGVIGKLGTTQGPIGAILGGSRAADQSAPVEVPGPPAAGDDVDAPVPDAPVPDPPPAESAGIVTRALSQAAGVTGMTRSDVIRGAVGVPVSVLKNELFSGSRPASPAMPSAPPAPPAPPKPPTPPAPRVPHVTLPPVPPGPAQTGGTVTVRAGDSLWEIAGGDPALVQQIAELNHLPDPSLIQPGQVLMIPEAAL